MKKIYLLAMLLGIIGLASCEDDQTPVLEVKTPARMEALPQAEYNITAANATQELTIKWTPADYGFQALVNYSVMLTNKKNNKSVKIGETTGSELKLTLAQLNHFLGKINVYPGTTEDVSITLDYSAYSGKLDSEGENAVDFKAGTYDPKGVEWNYVYIAVNYPEWDWTEAYLLGDVDGDGVYEGYVNFADDNMAFTVLDGKTLQPVGEATTVESKGFYKINANATGVVGEITTPIVWGLVGDATPGGWDSDTEMEYNPETRLWTKGVKLLKDKEYKFRGNKDWGINLGAVDGHAYDMGGDLVPDGQNLIVINEIDTLYMVELDLTQAGKYSYKIAETSFIPSAEYVTLPGNYQGWNPSGADVYRLDSPARDYVFVGSHYIPNDTEFKIYDKQWLGIDGAIEWNAEKNGGSFNVSADGGDILIEKGNYYKFTYHGEKKTCNFIQTGWGIVGDGSPSGDWNKDSMLTYNPDTKKWTGTFDFVGGTMKFRWDRGWDLNLGGSLDSLEEGGGDITISAGNYTVVLDPEAKKATMTRN